MTLKRLDYDLFGRKYPNLAKFLAISSYRAEDLSRNTFSEVLMSQRLLYIPNVPPDKDVLKLIGRSFGTLWNIGSGLGGNLETDHAIDESGEIIKVSNRGGALGSYEVPWHADISHHPSKPRPVRMLYGYNIPNNSTTKTKWISTYVNDHPQVSSSLLNTLSYMKLYNQAPYKTKWHGRWYDGISTHPYSGIRTINIDPLFNNLEKNKEKEQLVIKEIWQQMLLNEKAIYEHQWATGDLIIYDNWGLLHTRGSIPAEDERELWRITIDFS